MVDNTTLPGVGDVYASDDISGVKYQRVKIVHGIDGTNDGDVANTNAFPMTSKGGLVSTNNSTTSTLSADAVFTGTGDDVTHFASVSVSWNSNVASAALGLRMEFSTDNTNWDRSVPVSSNSDALQVNHGGVHRLSIIAQYFRVVYTNGGTIQTSFRLQTIFHSDNALPLVSRLEQQLSRSSDVMLTRPITVTDLDLARIQITGQRTFFFFGFNNDIDTAVWEDIHPNGGDVNWLTTAGTVEVLSSNANDTSAGTGVRSVEIHGLSPTGADQDEVIAMNGTSAVTSSLSYIRVNKMHNQDVGTYGGSHQGDITCRVSGGGATLALMIGQEGSVDSSVQYGSGEAGNGFYSVPLGKVAYLTGGSVLINTTGDKTADIVLYEREGILNISAPFDPRRILWNATEVQGMVQIELRSYLKIKALTDIFFRAQGSDDNTKISVLLEYYLVDANAAGA